MMLNDDIIIIQRNHCQSRSMQLQSFTYIYVYCVDNEELKWKPECNKVAKWCHGTGIILALGSPVFAPQRRPGWNKAEFIDLPAWAKKKVGHLWGQVNQQTTNKSHNFWITKIAGAIAVQNNQTRIIESSRVNHGNIWLPPMQASPVIKCPACHVTRLCFVQPAETLASIAIPQGSLPRPDWLMMIYVYIYIYNFTCRSYNPISNC